MPAARLSALLGGETGGLEVDGDRTVLGRLMATLDAPDPDFDIVTA
jgi:hypothetical protein